MFFIQISMIAKRFEVERQNLELRIVDLEQKLEGAMESFSVAESTLAIKNTELDALRDDLRELEELREMREVRNFYSAVMGNAVVFQVVL